jgi:hypothetical protein
MTTARDLTERNAEFVAHGFVPGLTINPRRHHGASGGSSLILNSRRSMVRAA